MKFELKNKDLNSFLQIIDKLTVSSMRVNRGKAKVYSAISDKLEEYGRDEGEILEKNIVTNEYGQLMKEENGDFILKENVTITEINQQLSELQEEVITISSGDYTNRFTDFFDWLSDCEENITTQEAILIDSLLEQFEAQKGE
ncbi:Protein of unknown function [Streptococcus henryi]|uniref:Phage protein n=1 Tax=Streptococcus henryi TaxID=439219 RepID=A0A1G6AJF7_9STRE|nr:DUF1617 family protein [Streptococcus henryi]QBX25311.1 hypothetical protein Javan252_0010 [Streptococcus phage Javan252]SDB08541.1 Protein of unknown function [Streptococcus henryi]